jgi:hypothetical protein
MVAHREQRLRLERRFANASDEVEALRIQREIENLVLANEIEILTLQLAHLRAANRMEEAQRLERSLEILVSPDRRVGPPESRISDRPSSRR